MQMTEYEIIKDYGEAKDKATQIGILADLNMCTKGAIVEILKKNGIPVPKGIALARNSKRTNPSYRVSWDGKNLALLKRYIDEGLSNREIAERFGVSVTAIASQVNKRGLRKESLEASLELACDSNDAAACERMEEAQRVDAGQEIREIVCDSVKEIMYQARNIRGIALLAIKAMVERCPSKTSASEVLLGNSAHVKTSCKANPFGCSCADEVDGCETAMDEALISAFYVIAENAEVILSEEKPLMHIAQEA